MNHEPTPPAEPGPREKDRSALRRIYRLRVLGLGLGFVCVGSVFAERGAPPVLWALLAADGFLWPHAAWLLASRAADPRRAELGNLLLDSAMGGVWIALMALNLMPSVLIFTMLNIDKIGIRGWRFAGKALLLQALAFTLAFTANGFAFAPATSTRVLIACMPFLVAYPLAISVTAHALSARVRRQNQMLAELSRTDALTGLPNRTYWEDVAGRELRRSQRIARPASLLVIDIDNFKQVNDRFGHPAGDELLQRIAWILRKGIRDIDTLCRYGGDEFCIVLPETGGAAAVQAAERLRQRTELETAADPPHPRSTISIGVAEATDGIRELRDWIRTADTALYRAKAEGRNRVASS